MKVYPRPRGGAVRRVKPMRAQHGLSPPTRGSRLDDVVVEHRRRSIPAHAGEPRTATRFRRACRVYPRPRGGATEDLTKIAVEYGLSPPTRGSLAAAVAHRYWTRSIPAHAGEPY